MQRRPTIPVADWRIATHLSATHAVQRQHGSPAEGCACKWCQNWHHVASHVLPGDLSAQLERFGIDVSHPTDLYAYQCVDQGAFCRVIFHVVGKLLSGPLVIRQDPAIGQMWHYQELRAHPQVVTIAVVPCRETSDFRPKQEDELAGDLVQIDLRLFVPLHTVLVHGVAK